MALKHRAVLFLSLPWYVQRRGGLTLYLIHLYCSRKKYLVLRLLLQISCILCVAYLASSAFNSMICVGRNVESLETPSCTGSNPEPTGWRELKCHLALGGPVIKPVQFKMAFCSWVHPVNPEGTVPPPKLRPCASVRHLSIPWCQTLPGAVPLLPEMLPCPAKPRTDKPRK